MKNIFLIILLYISFNCSSQQIQRNDMLPMYKLLSAKNWDSAFIAANDILKRFPDDSSDFKANVNYAVILSAAGMVANNKMTYPELRETLRPFLGKYIMMPAHPTTTDTLTTSSGITILGENKSGIKGTTITQSADKKTVLCFENFEFSDPIIISDYDKVRTRCGGKLAIVEINPYMDNIWILRLRITDAIIQKI